MIENQAHSNLRLILWLTSREKLRERLASGEIWVKVWSPNTKFWFLSSSVLFPLLLVCSFLRELWLIAASLAIQTHPSCSVGRESILSLSFPQTWEILQMAWLRSCGHVCQSLWPLCTANAKDSLMSMSQAWKSLPVAELARVRVIPPDKQQPCSVFTQQHFLIIFFCYAYLKYNQNSSLNVRILEG